MSVTPNVFREHHAGRIDVTTVGLGLLPDFDLDRGTGFAGSVQAILEPGHRVLNTTMTAADHLVALVPDTVTQGQYDVLVETNDGRSARMRDAVGVAPGELVIETLASNVVYVPPPDHGRIPIWVNLRNNTACTLRELAVTIRVSRDTDDTRTDLVGSELSVYPNSGMNFLPVTRPCDPEIAACDPPAVISFWAETSARAMAGAVTVDASATAQRGPDEVGCSGRVNAPFALTRLRLFFMTQISADLQVEQLRVYPDQLRLISHGINLTFRLRNTSSQPVTIDELTLASSPRIIASTDPPEINPRVIQPGADAAYQLSAMLEENLRARQVVTLTVGAIGHDEAGVYHTTRMADQSTTVTIHD